MKIIIAPSFLIAATLLTACGASTPSSNTYSSAQAGQLQEVQFAEVLSVRKVKIKPNSAEAGKISGGIIGGAAGSTLGKGTGEIVGGVTGAVVGSTVGVVADYAVNAKDGIELTLKLKETGKTIALVQLADATFKEGDKVRIITSNGVSRVAH